MDVIDGLMRFGLTRQESVLYIKLLENGAMTGYEAAKMTGISRSNTYTALAALVDKGAACRADGTPTQYVPVGAGEFLDNKIRSLSHLKEELKAQLPGAPSEDDAYITIKGAENISHKMEYLITSAVHRIYIAAEFEKLQPFFKLLGERASEGMKVVVISDRRLCMPGLISYVTPRPAGQIGLITDSRAVLTGEIPDNGPAVCLYSQKKNLVDLFKTSLSNEIKLIEITMKGAQVYEKGAICNERTD